jgi:hypothetical protein
MTTQTLATTKSNCPQPTGWLIKAAPGYYTGNQHSQLECWTAFPKLAKVYKRKAWAQKIAERTAGQVIPAPVQPSPNGHPRAQPHLQTS